MSGFMTEKSKTLKFSLRQQSLPGVTHKRFTAPSENCFFSEINPSKSHKTAPTVHRGGAHPAALLETSRRTGTFSGDILATQPGSYGDSFPVWPRAAPRPKRHISSRDKQPAQGLWGGHRWDEDNPVFETTTPDSCPRRTKAPFLRGVSHPPRCSCGVTH